MWNSTWDVYTACRNSAGSKAMNTIYSIFSTFFLLPLFLFILYTGFRRRRRRRSAGTSHTDFFTYNMMVMECVGVLASAVYTFSFYVTSKPTFLLGMFLFSVSLPAETYFHALTCMERHLAVVHPIAYTRLREPNGVRIRNVSAVCVWLLGLGWMGLTALYLPGFPTILFFLTLGVCVFIVCSCCLSVLGVLTRSGPGKADERVDQSKRRAFYMIVAITGALLLRFVGLSVSTGLIELVSVDLEDLCALMDSGLWFTVPSRVVLPLLYLHRAGTLPGCRKKTDPKDGAE